MDTFVTCKKHKYEGYTCHACLLKSLGELIIMVKNQEAEIKDLKRRVSRTEMSCQLT